MKVNGKMSIGTVKALTTGTAARNTEATTKTGKCTEKEYTSTKIIASMKASTVKAGWKVTVLLLGAMVASTKASGRMTTGMVKAA